MHTSPIPSDQQPPVVRAIVREVGLRDGLQSIATVVSTAHKIEWINAAYAAGQREIEVGSFVPARLLPQLADTAEVLAHAKTLPGLVASVLVPNFKGAERALDCGADLMVVPLSASHAHSLANLRKTPDEVVAELARIRALRDSSGRRTLIEGGVLRGYLQDEISARHFGIPSSGSGRRETFKHYIMPRMTNTLMLPGESTHDEIVRSVDRGIYCVAYAGGQVNISTGDFTFSVTEAYLIEGGKVTSPLKNVMLIGNGPDEFLYASVPDQAIAGGGCLNVNTSYGGCLYLFNLTGLTWDTSALPTAKLQAVGGGSGIVMDNTSSLTGASQIYFSTLRSPGNAVQASQAGLQ